MQIVSRRTMLALPVERLVGSSTSNNNNNNSNENNNRRPTMSPDSSGSSNISDSSGSSARSDSPNAKVYSSYMSNNNNNNNTSTKSDNSINKYSPIRSQSISPTTAASSPPLTPPAVISSTSDQAEDSTGNSKFRCSCNGNGEESSRNINTGRPVVGGYGMTLSSPSSSGQEEIQFKTENNNNNNNRNEDEEMDDDRKEEGNNHPEPSATNAIPLLVQSSKKIRIIENECLNKMGNMDSMSSSGDDEIENNATRPPSRPPSSASSNFTTASTNTTFPLSPNSDIKPIPMISRPQHHHHHHHNNGSLQALKFSIEDILRPEFGKSAVIKTRPPSSNSNRRCNSIVDFLPDSPSSIRSKESLSNNHRNNNDYGQQVSPRQNYHHRPSSIKDHSEDSNSSCTSRKEEVVDESKVNPPVPAGPLLWPAWVYCTRYSDRPSSGPRSRRIKKREPKPPGLPRETPEEKRPRTAFTAEQLARLKQEFDENRYLTEKRRQDLARDLKLHENQIKIWFQNKRAKLKKSNGPRGGLAMQLMAQGLYNHSTVPIDEDDEMYEAMMQK